MSEYVTNAELRMKYVELEAAISARASEEIAKSKDEAYSKALKAAEDELQVTEKTAEAQKAAFNRVMDERLPIAQRTAEAMAAIQQRNRVFGFQIQEEATKKAQEAADERVEVALKEADANLKIKKWGFAEYQSELDRLLKEEVSMSDRARTKITDKERELKSAEALAQQKATEDAWQDEIDAAVAGWDQKLKLEKTVPRRRCRLPRMPLRLCRQSWTSGLRTRPSPANRPSGCARLSATSASRRSIKKRLHSGRSGRGDRRPPSSAQATGGRRRPSLRCGC